MIRLAFAVALTAAAFAQRAVPGHVEVLKPTGGLPASIQSKLALPVSCAQTRAGEYLVLDRRAHTVYAINAARTTVRQVVQIGIEKGRLLQPAAFALSGDDVIAVADAPAGYERIQLFSPSGSARGAFVLDRKIAARLWLGPIILNGIGSMAFTGTSFFVSRPEAGALIAELAFDGNGVRQFGALRRTGHEADRDLHLAFNIGLPLVDPTGRLWVSLMAPVTYVYDRRGDKIRTIEFDTGAAISPSSFFFTKDGRLLITPGCYEFSRIG